MMIRVNGLPAPQGSKTPTGNGGMRESSRAVGPWREAVRTEVQRAGGAQLAGPVAVSVQFFLARPASRRDAYPAKRPDLDKLCRAILDGLKAGGAYRDDGQVVSLTAAKFWAHDGQPAGCMIAAGPYDSDQEAAQ
jgi:Holliday junction resolvase RusA-like endonuclease